MDIQKQILPVNAIQSYTTAEISINDKIYNQSLLVSAEQIWTPWRPRHCQDIQISDWEILSLKGFEVIIIGHHENTIQLPNAVRQYLSQYQIGIEVMGVGAACRTFNILLSEERHVLLGLIF